MNTIVAKRHPTYEVLVRGYGYIYCGGDLLVARTQFTIFRQRSINRKGRSSGKEVQLLMNGKVLEAHKVCAGCSMVVERTTVCCGDYHCDVCLKKHDVEADAEYGHEAYRKEMPLGSF